MRDPAAGNRYHDIELLDLGDEGWATLTADDTVVRYRREDRDAAIRMVQEYRLRYGRRPADGGPLEWPPIEREFKEEAWDGDD